MLAIGRALMGNPELLLMDEPSEGLAPLFVRYIETILQELRREKGFSILLVEQTLRLAFGVADYVYIMSKGKVVFQSKPDELKDNEEVKVKHLGV
jgi:branched-chain amino acid transport system ATP-binding protein